VRCAQGGDGRFDRVGVIADVGRVGARGRAVRSRFPWYLKLWGGHQGARSLHFIGMVLMSIFIVMHIGLVFLVHPEYNLPHMVFGVTDTARYAQAFTIAIATIVVVIGLWIALSYLTLADRPRSQRVLVALTEPIRKVTLNWMKPRMGRQSTYTEKDISEFHWTNGLPPTKDESTEWLAHRDSGFRDWRLELGGELSGKTLQLSLGDLRQLPKTEYIAVHTCMQGWSATSKWAGVRLRDLLEVLGPPPEGANYVMITSHGLAQEMWDHRPREPFYAVLDLDTVAEDDTIPGVRAQRAPVGGASGRAAAAAGGVEPWVQDGQVDQVHRVDHRLRRVR